MTLIDRMVSALYRQAEMGETVVELGHHKGLKKGVLSLQQEQDKDSPHLLPWQKLCFLRDNCLLNRLQKLCSCILNSCFIIITFPFPVDAIL